MPRRNRNAGRLPLDRDRLAEEATQLAHDLLIGQISAVLALSRQAPITLTPGGDRHA